MRFIILLFIIFIFSCSPKVKECKISEPKVITKTKYIEKTVYYCPISDLNIEKPKLLKTNVMKVKVEDQFFYCYDLNNAKKSAINIQNLLNYANQYYIILNRLKNYNIENKGN